MISSSCFRFLRKQRTRSLRSTRPKFWIKLKPNRINKFIMKWALFVKRKTKNSIKLQDLFQVVLPTETTRFNLTIRRNPLKKQSMKMLSVGLASRGWTTSRNKKINKIFLKAQAQISSWCPIDSLATENLSIRLSHCHPLVSTKELSPDWYRTPRNRNLLLVNKSHKKLC